MLSSLFCAHIFPYCSKQCQNTADSPAPSRKYAKITRKVIGEGIARRRRAVIDKTRCAWYIYY